MNRNHQEDEFVAVRVQDPRVQHEGSWNSYVDYKIFLHTNSKAFTAKTSCVRRRYSEFVWLKKQLQKNAGLVPVPDLPGKSFFSFSNEDFLERRRKGLQGFLDKVVNTTVCLSDSQLHLFLQTQLPVGHIQDCVQGHTPYSVTDAILTYASSNQGLVQAQDEDSIKEPSLTVSYESMESPAPHQPCPQTEEMLSQHLSCIPDPLEDLLEPSEHRLQKKPSVKISEKKNLLEAVVECVCEPSVTFFLGDHEDEESLSPVEDTAQASCQIQTQVEVHSPVEDFSVDSVFEEESMEREEDEESVVTVDTEEKAAHVDQAVPQFEVETEQMNSPEAANTENLNSEPEKCVTSVVLDVKDNETEGLIQAANDYMKTSSRNILDLQMNGYPEEKENISPRENEDLQYMTSVHLNSVAGEDLPENRSFIIFDSNRVPELAVGKHAELRLDASDETQVEVH
ncbi:sorting nexin-11 [Betta splendens]|uniref:Sorting nexin-11 n=1 Tax=Betta splendens TaxID=158456 RepID=A0A6P7L384_BETSP|nr:sorting nexin-11 [Betta splendens]